VPAGTQRRGPGSTARLRAVIAMALIALWTVSAVTGFVLYGAPTGPRSGRLVVLLLTKPEWKDVHFWFSVAASVVTVVHVLVDWRALKACVRFLASAERGERPTL